MDFLVGPFSSYTFFALNQQVLSSHVFFIMLTPGDNPKRFFLVSGDSQRIYRLAQAVKGTKGAGKSKGTKGRGAPPNKGAQRSSRPRDRPQKPPSFQPRSGSDIVAVIQWLFIPLLNAWDLVVRG